MIWELRDVDCFNNFVGPLLARREGEQAIVRLQPRPEHANYTGAIHGGLMMGFIDCALFAGAAILGAEGTSQGLTLECNVQFLASGRLDVPLDAVIDVLRITGRFVFLRGLLVQEGANICNFSGMLRKASAKQ
jgi:uncharacterized protein (TIGR00369 family)